MTEPVPKSATTKRGCRICGVIDSTESHLIPRALVHDAKGGAKHLLMGTRFADGTKYTQAGLSDDDILCARHESTLADADKAGVEFTRFMLEEYRDLKPNRLVVEGGGSDRLIKFFVAVMWRCSVSDKFGVHDFHLGAATEKKLQAILFQDAPIGHFPAVSIRAVRSDLPHMEGLIHTPKLHLVKGRRLVRFLSSSLLWIAEIGWKRPFLDPDRINGKDKVVTGFMRYEEMPEFQGSIDIFANMDKPRAGWPIRQRKPKPKP